MRKQVILNGEGYATACQALAARAARNHGVVIYLAGGWLLTTAAECFRLEGRRVPFCYVSECDGHPVLRAAAWTRRGA